jgi:hypothetical protein
LLNKEKPSHTKKAELDSNPNNTQSSKNINFLLFCFLFILVGDFGGETVLENFDSSYCLLELCRSIPNSPDSMECIGDR